MISRALMVLVVISSLSVINTTPKAMAETSSASANNSTVSGSETTASTYENVTYGISSIQYPSDWTVNNTNKPAKDISIFSNELNDRSIFNIVSFYAPPRSYPKSQHLPSVSISINFPGDSQFVTSLSGYLNHTIYLYANVSKMKTPIMTTNDMGNGSNREIVILMAMDIPNHIIWFIRNCLLLLSRLPHTIETRLLLI